MLEKEKYEQRGLIQLKAEKKILDFQSFARLLLSALIVDS